MNGLEHYAEAERLLANVQSAIDADGPEAEGGISEWTALAQVHATLADVWAHNRTTTELANVLHTMLDHIREAREAQA